MSQSTTNYNLKKLELTDAADITAINSNWDTIDTTMKGLNDGKAAASHEHSAISITSGTLPVVRGGTGVGELTSGSYLVGNGTGSVTLKTPAEVLADVATAITGGASSVMTDNLTASKVLVSDGSGKISASSVASTKVGYLSDVTSNIQAQLNAKQGAIAISDTDLTAGTSPLDSGVFYAYYE